MLKFLIRGESVLEERLAQIGKMVDPQSRVADIGTDHAYLPIALVEEGKIDFAIASDVAAGPLDNAKQELAVIKSQLKEMIRRQGQLINEMTKVVEYEDRENDKV